MAIALATVATTAAITAAVRLAIEYGPDAAKAAKLKAAQIKAGRASRDSAAPGVVDLPDRLVTVASCVLDWSHGQGEDYRDTRQRGAGFLAVVMVSQLERRAQLQAMGAAYARQGDQQRGLLYTVAGDMHGIPYQWGGQSTRSVDCSGAYLLAHEQLSQLGVVKALRSYSDRTANSMKENWAKVQPSEGLLGDALVYSSGGDVQMYMGSGIVYGSNGGGRQQRDGKYKATAYCRAKRWDFRSLKNASLHREGGTGWRR